MHHSKFSLTSTHHQILNTLNRLKLFGEEQASIANSYYNLDVTQYSLGDFNAAIDSKLHSLDIRLKLFGVENADIAYSYYDLGITQHSLGDFNAALDSKQHAIDIRLKLFGEDPACTDDIIIAFLPRSFHSGQQRRFRFFTARTLNPP